MASSFDLMTRRNSSPKSGIVQRVNTLLLGVPVFVKVMGIAVGVAAMLGGGMLWQIHETWHNHLVADLEHRAQKLADEVTRHCERLARQELTANIPAELQHSLSEEVDAVYIIAQRPTQGLLGEARVNHPTGAGAAIREATARSSDGAFHVRVGLSTNRVEDEVGWLTRRLTRTTALITLLGMLAAWWLTHIFAHPIQELVELTRAVKAGHYQTKAPVRANDEVGELAAAFNEMTDAIAQKEAARQKLLRQVIRAGEEERKRIARELHDHTGQALTSQIASLSALENQCPTEKICQRLVDLRQQTERTLSEVHDLSVALRPSVLDDVGLMAALDRHCRLFARQCGVEVVCLDLGLDGQRLPAEIELTIYRVVQEALTNGFRHGGASRLQAVIQRNRASVLVVVRDNGCGFDAHNWQKRCIEGNHLGLLGIEERVQLVGGSFCVDSSPGKGVTVFADIPLKENE